MESNWDTVRTYLLNRSYFLLLVTSVLFASPLLASGESIATMTTNELVNSFIPGNFEVIANGTNLTSADRTEYNITDTESGTNRTSVIEISFGTLLNRLEEDFTDLDDPFNTRSNYTSTDHLPMHLGTPEIQDLNNGSTTKAEDATVSVITDLFSTTEQTMHIIEENSFPNENVIQDPPLDKPSLASEDQLSKMPINNSSVHNGEKMERDNSVRNFPRERPASRYVQTTLLEVPAVLDKSFQATTQEAFRFIPNVTPVMVTENFLENVSLKTPVRNNSSQQDNSRKEKKENSRRGLDPEEHPFLVLWNIPSQRCGNMYGLLPKLDMFGIVSNSNQQFYGDKIVIFYANQLGHYPRVLEDGEVINGGIPQLAKMDSHLAKATRDIEKRIPDERFDGYAVIDWEAWRPIFRRNWGIHRHYKKRAIRVMRKLHPSWDRSNTKRAAKKEFDTAAKRFMETTLLHAKSLRPRAKWGYYLFPDCYNFKNGQNYCQRQQMKRNDRLYWMFNISDALYPSIYLTQKMPPKYRAAHIEGILKEAYRVQKKYTDRWEVPVLPYARIRYGDTNFLLSQEDLEGTIGQAATTGASGVILWEKYTNTVGKRKCQQLYKYVNTILGPYLKIIRNFTTTCGRTLCNNKGRCLRRSHYPPKRKSKDETSFSEKYVSLFSEYKENFSKSFKCHCYRGWSGKHCLEKDI